MIQVKDYLLGLTFPGSSHFTRDGAYVTDWSGPSSRTVAVKGVGCLRAGSPIHARSINTPIMESLKNYRLYHYIRLTKFYGIILHHGSMCIDKQISLVCWGLMLLITGTKILYKKFFKAF